MDSARDGDTSSTRDDLLIEAARRDVFGDAEPAVSATMTHGAARHEPSPGAASAGHTAGSAPTQSVLTPPDHIGPYHIKRRIAAGGMSVVYEAAQEHPRRTVAIKVMKQGIPSRRAVRRFQYESQVLARLRHRCIAHVYDAGWYLADGERRPYFAMEYLPNATPITKYALQRELPVRERLGLFVDVCEALHHGHQRGVIHRDVKPGNILIDAEGQVKVIDFGVARSTDSDLNITALQTSVGEMVGTLKYMSPEQCKADPNDLDVRSDIYSLGVVLFELLSGHLPYDLDSTPIASAPRRICEEPPSRLSALDRSLRGDIETIVGKALEKDRQRRYQSASALADDIRRYLANEPILARPPSAVYRFRKLVRRRRGTLAAVVLLAITAIVAAVAEGRARFNQAAARDRARENEMLKSHLAVMNEGAPLLAGFPQDQVEDILGRLLTSETPGTPAREQTGALAELLGTFDRAIELDRNNANAHALRGRVHFYRDNYVLAERDCAQALRVDPDNNLALRTCAFVAQKRMDYARARQLYEQALSGYAFSTDLARDFHNLARLRRIEGDYAAAIGDHDRALALGADYAMPWKGRGITRYLIGDIDGAIGDLEQSAKLAAAGNNAYEVVRCRLWIWEIRMLRNGPGDREAGQAALAAAESAAPPDYRVQGLFAVLHGTQSPEEYLASLTGPQAASDRAQGCYYLAVQSLLDGRPDDAQVRFREAASDVLQQYDEYDLARWHLKRLPAPDDAVNGP